MKLRPVLLLTGAVGPVPEFLVAYISSVIPSPLLATDIILDPMRPEHASTHLKVISALRLHKLATIHGRSITRRLGSLSVATAADVADKLRLLLRL